MIQPESRPRIAVVIPARECPCQQLMALRAQSSLVDRVVVVLQDGGPETVCGSHLAVPGRLTVMTESRGPHPGPGAARNDGARSLAGSADILLFCDADDRVSPNWASKLAVPLATGAADVIGGALRLVPSPGAPVIVAPRTDFGYRQALFGANMGLTAPAWTRLGGFDPRLACCEDTDLAWRAGEAGLRVAVANDALVDYQLRKGLHEFHQRWRWGRSSVGLLKKHGLPLDRLPGLLLLYHDKRDSGFAKSPWIAALGQWVGQCSATWVVRLAPPDGNSAGVDAV